MTAVVADTHAFVWHLTEPRRLSAAAREALESATEGGCPICVSAVSMVEVAYLAEKGRLPDAVVRRIDDALADPEAGISIVALDLAIARAVREIPRDVVPDMPDRIIAATALHLGLPLVSRDGRIRATRLETIW